MIEELRDIQQRIERYYALESAPDVADFVRVGDAGCRESVLVRQDGDDVEIAVVLPPMEPGRPRGPVDDARMQRIEGVSHFVHLADRARTELPTTRLELEIQAEVDKFVLIALDDEPRTSEQTMRLHDALYTRFRHLHPARTESGQRYRLANHLAARLASRIVEQRDWGEARCLLRRFYRAGQADKIRLAQTG